MQQPTECIYIYICYGDGGVEEVVEGDGEAAEEGLVELERGLAVEHGELVDGEGEAPLVAAPGSVGEEDVGVVGGDAADPGRQRGDAGAGSAVGAERHAEAESLGAHHVRHGLVPGPAEPVGGLGLRHRPEHRQLHAVRAQQPDRPDPRRDRRRAVHRRAVRDRVDGQAHEQPRRGQVVHLVALAAVLAGAEEAPDETGRPEVPANAAATMPRRWERDPVRRACSTRAPGALRTVRRRRHLRRHPRRHGLHGDRPSCPGNVRTCVRERRQNEVEKGGGVFRNARRPARLLLRPRRSIYGWRETDRGKGKGWPQRARWQPQNSAWTCVR